MSTNYYLRTQPCEKCGHSEYKKHIGKSSSGWEFCFRGYLDESIVSYQGWVKEISCENKEIIDECGNIIKFDAFTQIISRKGDHLLNIFNVTKGVPITQKEKEYCSTRHNQYGMSSDTKAWKDNQGFAFIDNEFS